MAASTACAQGAPAKFSLQVNGQAIGTAQYQFFSEKTVFGVKAEYTYSLRGVQLNCARAATLGADYEVLSDTLIANVSGTNESASFAADAKNSKFMFTGSAGSQEVRNSFPLHARTAVLDNFDPSGVQELVYLASKQSSNAQDYWVLMDQGSGIQLAASFVPATGGEGTLNGTKVTLKHWRLTVGAVVSDIWADEQNNLMQLAAVSQPVAYTRIGFELKTEPAAPAPSSAKPSLAGAADERAVSFTSDGLKFPAMLVLPKNRSGPVPIVVLVHGSGPQDADETIGPNKPFRDLAEGLATYGIATLRYDKRTHFAPQSYVAHQDVDHETVLDAVAALGYASSLPEIDGRRVFLLGHSLGGMMAPVIAADRLRQDPGTVRGIIFLAGAALNIEDTIERQFTAMAKHKGEDASQIDAMRKQWERIFARINDPATAAGESLGVPPVVAPESYWRSLMKQDPAAELKQLGLPALVLRGTKDIQVSEGDFDALAEANTAAGSMSREVDRLNHLFMPVAVESTGADYFLPSHVDAGVARMIARWIASLK